MSIFNSSPADPQLSRASSTRSLLLGLLTLLCCILAIIVRFDACCDDLWADELHTAWVVDGEWKDLPARAAIGNQPPLYFALVKTITQFAGLSEASIRSLSFIAGLGLIFASWWFTWRITADLWCALLAITVVGLDSTCIFYATEARPYALMQLALAWLVILVIEGGSNSLQAISRALLAAFAIHLQFTSLIFLAPLYAARVVMLSMSPKTERLRIVATLGIEITILLVLSAPLTSQVLEIANRGQAWATFVPDPSFQGLLKLFPWSPAVVSVLAFLIPSQKEPLPKVRRPLGWLAWLNLSPIALATFVSWIGLAPLFFRRYLLGAEWPLLMIPSLALSLCRGVWKLGLASLILFAVVWESKLIAPECWSIGRLTQMRNEAWTDAANHIATIDPNGEFPVFVASGFIESRQLDKDPSQLLRDYCRLPIATLYRTPHSLESVEPISSVIPRSPPDRWVNQVLKKQGGIWLLRVQPKSSQPWQRFGERLRETLVTRSGNDDWTIKVHAVSGITILELRRNMEEPP